MTAAALGRAQFTNSLGDGAFYVTSVLAFTSVADLSAAQVGTGLTIGWGAGFLAAVPLGQLSDRVGPRRTAVWLSIGTAVALCALLTVRSPLAFTVAVCGYAICQSGLSGVRQALLAGLVPADRRTAARAMLQSVQNAGIAVGAGVGGLALVVDRPGAYLTVLAADAAAFLVAAALLHRLPEVPPVPAPGRRLPVLRDRRFATLAALNAVLTLYLPVLSVALPLWIAGQTAAPRWLVAALFLLNTLTVAVAQRRVATLVHTLRDAGRAVGAAGALLLGACAVFATSTGTSALTATALLIAGSALLVLGEMLLAAGGWHIAFTLAPDHAQGQYQALYAAGVPVARMIGPLLVTTVLLPWGPGGWLALGGAFLLAGAATARMLTPARVVSR
jgi:MFS family permease